MNAGRAVLVGSGLAGLVQALALADAGIDVTLVGPLPAGDKDERTTAILNPGIDLLISLGLWDVLAPTATPLVTMELVDGGQPFSYDAAEIGQPQFGFNISNAALKQELVRRLDAHAQVTWHKTLAETIDKKHGWQIGLKDGRTINADLLIGADGRHGLVRAAAGIALREKEIDQQALVTVLQSEKPHFNITLEVFRPGGPLTLVPAGRNRFALVWCDHTAALQGRLAADDARLGDVLTDLTGGRFGALVPVGARQLWPVQPMHVTALVGDRVVLIGEAAHTLPPIGAQGFNTTLQDIIALTGILRRNAGLGLRLDDGGQLLRYQSLRLPDILLRYRSVNALNSLLRSRNPLAHRLRRLSLGTVDRFDLLKRQLMAAGSGPRR